MARLIKAEVLYEVAPIDGLCEVCWLPSLESRRITILSLMGVDARPAKTVCRSCSEHKARQ